MERIARLALTAVVAAGVWLRCDGLDRKVYWYDEVDTSLRISGRTESELERLYDGRERRAGDLVRDFQTARGERIPVGVILEGSLREEPQAGAVYFPAASLWARVFGDDPRALRGLSAVASVIALGLLYALATALFPAPLAGWLAAALAAVSPLQIRYAQEARSYALWSVLILASTLLLVRALRGGAALRWILYGASMALSLYLQPLSAAVLAAHAIAVAPRWQVRRADVGRFVLAGGSAVLAWLPWAWILLLGRDTLDRTLGWTAVSPDLVERVRAWGWVLTGVFFRTGPEGGILASSLVGERGWESAPAVVAGARFVLVAGLFALIGGAVVALARSAAGPRGAGNRAAAGRLPSRARSIVAGGAPSPAAPLVSGLVAVPFLMLALPDLILGGRRAGVDRYLVPAWLGLELLVAWTLTLPGATRFGAWWRVAVAVLLLGLGFGTALRMRPLPVWWNTDPPALRDLIALGAHLGSAPDSILVTDLPPVRLLQVARRLDPAHRLRLGVAATDRIPDGAWSDVVLVAPGPALLEAARSRSGRAVERSRIGVELDLWRFAVPGAP